MKIIKRRAAGAHQRRSVNLSSRSALICVLSMLFQLAAPNSWGADSLDRKIEWNIAANTTLEDALIAWGTQAGMTVMINTPTVVRRTTAGVHGMLSARHALIELLRDSGLSYTVDGERVRVVPIGANINYSLLHEPSELNSDVRLQVASDTATSSAAERDDTSTLNPSRRKELDEIVVTAEKRSERIQDVPVPVTAVSADVLVETNQLRAQDFASTIPGFSVSPSPSALGAQMLAVRGISTGFNTNPTVGITIDDVPYGSSGNFLGSTLPDIDPSDLERIELLRGPQGTLYGASSMGGLLKYVTRDPSTTEFSGHVEAGTSSVYNGNELGYNVRGSVNVPLGETCAVRASAFTRQDPGYIDDPVLKIDGINKVETYGGHLAALWRPSEALSLKLSALFQDTKANGNSDVDVLPGLGDLQQSYLPGAGAIDQKAEAYSAVIAAKLGGGAELTSITGYNVNKISTTIDFSYLVGSLNQSAFGVMGAPLVSDGQNNKFSQEIRVSVPLGEAIDLLIGGFYTHEQTPITQHIYATNVSTGAIVGLFAGTSDAGYNHDEYAAFTNLTLHFTDRFDIQLGGREAETKERDHGYISLGGHYAAPAGTFTPGINSSGNAFTYLLTPRFKISSDLMVYARAASGYRVGGSNGYQNAANPLYDPQIPTQYSSDKTQNYEVGAKGDLLDRHLLSFDTSLYYIKWNDIQVNLASPISGATYTTNGSAAKSQGVELALASRPLTSLRLSAWVTWTDALLTEPMPVNSTAYGLAGFRLPYSSRFSGNLSIDDEFPLWRSVDGFIGGTVSFVGDREGTFTSNAERQDYPGYTKTDLRAGAKHASWTLSLFANNVTDRRALIGGGLGNFPPYAFSYIQPRIVGLSVSYLF